MLVITRREGEEMVIGNPSNPVGTVRVASIKGDRVRLAFNFPKDVELHRKEIADKISTDRTDIAGRIDRESRPA